VAFLEHTETICSRYQGMFSYSLQLNPKEVVSFTELFATVCGNVICMRMVDNKSVYQTSEFKEWAKGIRLIPEEEFLIANFLDPQCKTMEAGVGGGRIILAMASMGFRCLQGFDFIREFVEQARARDTSGKIRFTLQDAVNLGYQSQCFGQAVYLQQIICFIENERDRERAVREASRVLQPGGTALFSFLSFDVRKRNLQYFPIMTYLAVRRKLLRSARNVQILPWLKRNGKFNYASLLDVGPYVYWYRNFEAIQLLQSAGFCIKAVGTGAQARSGKMCSSIEELNQEKDLSGKLYVVCSK